MRTLRLSLVGTVILALLSGLGGAVVAQETAEDISEPASILLVGNSLTFYNDGVFSDLARLIASQDPPGETKVEHFTLGGYTLKDHYRDSVNEARYGAIDGIRSGKHDVIVLQDDIPEFKDGDLGQFMEYAQLFDEETDAVDAQTVFFMAWPYSRLGWVSLEEIEALHRQAEEELDATVAPVGMAFEKAHAERPEIRLLDFDAEHPSVSGTYLAAAVIYATVFDKSPEGLYYPDSHLTPDDAAYLQRIAWESVQEWREGVAVLAQEEEES